MTDREAIQSALQQVQAGEITPEQATEMLLAAENAETLESLIQRLGKPPVDVVNAWCDQMRLIASAHEADLGEPLPEIDLERWTITAEGDLLVQGRRLEVSEYAPRASQVSLDRILDFQRRYVPEHQMNARARSAEASQFPSKQPAVIVDHPGDQSADPGSAPQPKAKSNSSRNIRALMIAGTAACAVIAAFVLFGEPSGTTDSIAQNSNLQNSNLQNSNLQNSNPSRASSTLAPVTSVAPNNSSDLPTTDYVGDKSSDEIVTLETFEPTPDLESDPALEDELSMSLNGLMPDIDSLGSRPSPPDQETEADTEDALADVPTPGSPDPKPSATSEDESDSNPAGPGKGQIADDEPIPDESPQQTHESTVMSVRLADPDDVDSTVALADRPLSDLKIDFPYEVPLEVKQQDDVWSINDTGKNLSIAAIRSSGSTTELSWTETAKQSTAVSALVHGRLTDASGSTIFLRPTNQSDPWTFTFAKSDVMPTWNLGATIPPDVAHLEVKFDLPEDIEFGWVDPIESSKLRRARGTAVINVAGDEDVSLGIRFDVRCNRKLACRMRFAARLDPSMNWQIVSTPLLAKFSDQLSERSIAIANEGDRLAKVYRALSKREAKRYIRNKQDHIKDLAKQVESAAKRVAILQTLMTRLESQATIGFRVWVEWPDTEQDLLLASRPDIN